MTKKQKKMLIRILVTTVLLGCLLLIPEGAVDRKEVSMPA